MKFLFIHINKCGGTSLKKLLKKRKNILIPDNDNLFEMSNTKEWAEYKKFAIIRNPYSRILSLWGMINKVERTHNIDRILEIITNDDIPYKGDFEYGSDIEQKSYIKRHGLKMSHPHYSVVKNGEINIDKIFKLENITKEWPNIKEMLTLTTSLPRLNSTKNYNEDDFHILKQEQIKIINEYFKDDFEIFNYDML